MCLAPLVLASWFGLAPSGGEVRLADWGADPARGLLVNLTVGQPPFAPPDSSRPTLVVVHGVNLFHPFLHMTPADRYAEALARPDGSGPNVFAWDWNGLSPPILDGEACRRESVRQGEALARALIVADVDPATLQLVGQSSGALIVAVAARRLADATGRPVAVLTLLDPASGDHALLFGYYQPETAAVRVEHFWVQGLSGFGSPAGRPQIHEAALPAVRGWRGLLRPFHNDHLGAVRWHVGAVGR